MAFDPSGLKEVASAGGFTLWHYRTDDHIDSIIGWTGFIYGHTGYFDGAASFLREGHEIKVHAADGLLSLGVVGRSEEAVRIVQMATTNILCSTGCH